MNDNELIHRYEKKELTPTERIAFEKRLGQEPALRKALELYRDVALFSDIKSDTALQNTLKELGEIYFEEPEEKGKVLSLKRLFIAVAAMLLLAVGAWWLLLPPKHIRLYKQVAHTELSITTKKGNALDVQKMEALYNKGDYQQAIPLLQAYSDQHPNALAVKIALCVSFIEVENYTLANDLLSAIKSGNSAYKWEATFYLALLHLKQGEMETYNKYLDEIPASSPVFKRVKRLRE